MVAQIIGVFIHLSLCFVFVKVKGMDVFGLGLATLISYISMYFIVTIHANLTPEIKKALFWPTASSFTNWWPYVRIAIPAIVMQCAEVWAFDCMAFVAGVISVEDQAVFIIEVEVVAIIYMITVGSQSAICALVG